MSSLAHIEAYAIETNLCRQIRDRRLEAAPYTQLTPKELEIAKLLLRGLCTKEIAAAADITEKTCKQHIGVIFSKFAVKTRAELFARIFPT